MTQTESFEVLSEDGQRIRVRQTVNADARHGAHRPTYVAVVGRGIEYRVTPLGGNRFRIGGKVFKRCPTTIHATGRNRSDRRSGELPMPHVRSERAIHVNGRWFIATREGLDLGPYATHDDAESEAAYLATMLEGITDPEITRQFIVREFMLCRWARQSARPPRKK